ncbi:unnamed protein product [Auanema sp. JU1783]|nr:unnamed protein product [Auanema sp. JU1783]
MNKFKNFFRPKTNRKDDELGRFISIHNSKDNEENRAPAVSFKPKSKDPRDVGATDCYYTNVAPKTRRNLKSCPGGYKDDYSAAVENRSFDAEVRRRDFSPDFGRRSTRNIREKRPTRAYSEYGGDDANTTDVTHIPYRSYHREEFAETDEECDETSLKRANHVLERRIRHLQGRYVYYKSEYKALQKAKNEAEQAFLMRISDCKREIEELKKQNQMLTRSVKNLNNQAHASGPFSSGNYMPMPNFQFTRSNFQSNDIYQFTSINDNGSSIVSDPQPTIGDISCMQNTMFSNDEKDEIKNFRASETLSPSADHSSASLSNQALRELQQNS